MSLGNFRAKTASKFGNQPTTLDGKSFHSKLEANRFAELQLMERAGEIKDLQTQVTFRLDIGGVHICKYIADFTYSTKHGREIVEDTKGAITPIYTMKKRLMKAIHGIDILETRKASKKGYRAR